MKNEIIREPVCLNCKHLVIWPLCAAFQGEIPEDIRLGENDHDQPYPGDRGFQFEREAEVE